MGNLTLSTRNQASIQGSPPVSAPSGPNPAAPAPVAPATVPAAPAPPADRLIHQAQAAASAAASFAFIEDDEPPLPTPVELEQLPPGSEEAPAPAAPVRPFEGTAPLPTKVEVNPVRPDPAVEKLKSAQAKLKQLGYDIPVDGKMDTKTRNALSHFQIGTGCCGKGKDTPGVIGPVTLKRLDQMLKTKQVREKMVKTAEHNTHTRYDKYRNNLGQKASEQGLGLCYTYVCMAADKTGLGSKMQGDHAYQAISGLTRDPNYQEIQVPASQLDKLPAGAVVVWEKGRSPSGHISIADGNQHEISCHRGPQMTSHHGQGQPRVFLPIQPPSK